MESKLINEKRKASLEAMERLTPEERLRAAARSLELMTELHNAAKRARSKSQKAR